MDKEKIEKFMLESNGIEGEFGLNPNDILVAEEVVIIDPIKLEHILTWHKLLTRHLKVDWSGKWRKVNVRVGSWIAPNPSSLQMTMIQFESDLPKLNSWEAHNRFEAIHPFQDFNGRIGRLIWLSKAVREGYDGSISFLHQYYYQTLQHYHQRERDE